MNVMMQCGEIGIQVYIFEQQLYFNCLLNVKTLLLSVTYFCKNV